MPWVLWEVLSGSGVWPGLGKCPLTAQCLEPHLESRPSSRKRPLGLLSRLCQLMLKNLLFSFCCHS